MSFDMNLVNNKNLSNVQASSKTQDGGAGNTGYFMRGEQEENIGFYFKDTGSDSFEKAGASEEEDETDLLTLFLRFIEKLVDKIKAIFASLNKH